MLKPTELAAALLRAAVGAFHHAAAAPRHDRPARLAEPAADGARLLVRLSACSHARRAEERDRRPSDLRDLLEAQPELAGDLGD